MHVRFLGLRWNDAGALLSLQDADGELRSLAADAWPQISLRVLEMPRRCGGHWNAVAQQHVPCPAFRPLPSGLRHQCDQCRRKEALGFSAGPPAKVLAEQHLVYLALYAQQLKVGVTAEHRRLERLLEQGALAVCYLAQADGRLAREIEAGIAALSGITDRLSPQARLQTLFAPPPGDAEATELLAAARSRIVSAWPAEYRPQLLDPGEYRYLRPFYRQALPLEQARWVSNAAAGAVFSGQILGAIGALLVISPSDESETPLVIDSRCLRGFWLEVSAQEEPLLLKRSHPVISPPKALF